MQLTGSQVIIECLKEQGVDTVFGYPGGAILNVYDELYKHPEIKHVLTSHEQGASHAADGYARSTGKVGVCLATSGPGATNLVTGISTAYMDSIPIVAITCNVGVSLLGKDSFQEIDIAGITTPVTKYSFIVKDVEKLADTIRRAFDIARKGRPGPVLVDIPKNVTADLVEYTKQEIKLPERETETITDSDIDNAIELIKASKKPYIFVGGGVVLSGASKELKEFVDKVNAPVCDTLMGKGAYDGTSDNYTGMLCMHGTKTSNLGVSECDLLIAIGTRFSDRVLGNPKKFADQAKILQFDVDAAEINKNIRVTSSVIGDVKEILTRINKKLTQLDHNSWVEHVLAYAKTFPLTYHKEGLSGPFVIEKIYEMTKGNAIMVTEVGQHQMWAALHLRIEEPRTWLTSGGLGTMGFGLPAAMGAQLYYGKDRRVIHVAGDGGIKMTGNEFYTIARLNLPVVSLIVNNRSLGMIRQLQKVMYKERYIACELDYPMDYVKYAECFGIQAESVSTQDEFAEALKKALEDRDHPRVIVLNVWRSFVEPMIKGGARIDEFVEFK